MRTIHIDHYESKGPSVVCVGKFDGVHLGHQSLMRQTVSVAECATPTVYTFSRHPANVLAGRLVSPLITTNVERLEVIARLGIRLAVMDPFLPSLHNMSPAAFFEQVLLGRLKVATLVCSPRFHFGKDGAGDVALLERMCGQAGVELCLMQPVMQGGRIISSSWVRQSIVDGDVETASVLLGRPYCLTARVVEGDKRGQTLGMPTANQRFSPLKLRPKKGVYVSQVLVEGKRYGGVTAVSDRPTFQGGSTGSQVLAETHLLDYEGDLYGKTLQVDFLRRTRGIVNFATRRELMNQFRLDKEEARGGAGKNQMSHFFEK